MKKPDFFVVGAAKSGTTSMYHYLKQHPDIFLPPVKEPVYFASDIVEHAHRCRSYVRNFNQEKYFSNKEFPDRHIIFIKKFEYYKKLYEQAEPEKVAGDMSALYLFSKVAAENIKNFNADAKIIILLRNPVDRAFSQYMMRIRDGKIMDRNFLKEVISDFEKREEDCKEYYIEQGLYSEQIERYLNFFGEERVRIFLFEDFISNTKKVLSEIFAFLEVPDFPVDFSRVMNKSDLPKFPVLNSFLKGIKRRFNNFFPDKTPHFLKKIYDNFFMGKEKPKLSFEDRKYLLDYFREDIKKTEKLIGRDLSNWLLKD